MIVKKLKIQYFRNFDSLSLDFSPKMTVIVGDNAVGKTSVIEAINCISTIKSFRTNEYQDLINDSSDYFYLEAELQEGNASNKVSYYCDTKIKRIKLNNFVYSKLSEYVGFFNVVCFSALDFLNLKGSASERRKMFDLIFCQISKDYLVMSNYYKKLLKDRNTLLKGFILENRSEDEKLIDVITEQLIQYGNKIIDYRKQIISKLSKFAEKIHLEISGKIENLKLEYSPSVDKLTKEVYKKTFSDDLKRGFTTVGPHRDDYIFIVNNKNVGIFGSQGQQRNAILSSKLAMAELIFEIKKEAPTLLLDDVFSELDKNRQNALINSLNPNFQTIITTASISDLDKEILDKALIIKLDKRSE